MKRPPWSASPYFQSGFTLIEVLVALAIVSIALLAGMRATDSLVNNAQRLSNVLLGQICAENELIKMRLEVRLAKTMPNVGESQFSCEQAGHTFTGKRSVAATLNDGLRRVDALVMDGDATVLKLSTIVGRP